MYNDAFSRIVFCTTSSKIQKYFLYQAQGAQSQAGKIELTNIDHIYEALNSIQYKMGDWKPARLTKSKTTSFKYRIFDIRFCKAKIIVHFGKFWTVANSKIKSLSQLSGIHHSVGFSRNVSIYLFIFGHLLGERFWSVVQGELYFLVFLFLLPLGIWYH